MDRPRLFGLHTPIRTSYIHPCRRSLYLFSTNWLIAMYFGLLYARNCILHSIVTLAKMLFKFGVGNCFQYIFRSIGVLTAFKSKSIMTSAEFLFLVSLDLLRQRKYALSLSKDTFLLFQATIMVLLLLLCTDNFGKLLMACLGSFYVPTFGPTTSGLHVYKHVYKQTQVSTKTRSQQRQH